MHQEFVSQGLRGELEISLMLVSIKKKFSPEYLSHLTQSNSK
jgi:hypothetical protein